MKYKLLVVDIDGTLADKNGVISAQDKEALVRVAASGMYVSLCTGRVYQACSSIFQQLPLDGYHIFADGAIVSKPESGEEVYVQPISPDVLKRAVEFAHQHRIELELYSATRYFAERETWSTSAHREFFGIEPIIVDFAELWERERMIKGGLVVLTPEEAARTNDFCLQFAGSLKFSWARTPAYPGIDFVNVIAPEVSKGRALEALASHLGISMSEVVAVGDGSNDVSLLSAVGLAVAMDNAPDEVKAVADYITLDVEHSGLAAAINRFLLSV